MSLYSALRSSVSNITATSERMSIISNNIANTNSISYKRVDSSFTSFVTENENNNRLQFSAGGVRSRPVRNISEQGQLQITNNVTDLAVLGDGYFAVTKHISEENGEWSPASEILYTRRGDFQSDREGNLRNADGHYLLSWAASADGTKISRSTSSLDFKTVNIGSQLSSPIASTDIGIGVNIIPELARDQEFSLQYEIRDARGNPEQVELTFKKIPSEDSTIFFTVPGGTLNKQVQTTVPGGWRVYTKFLENDNVGFQNFDGEGNELGLVQGSDVAIADLLFDSEGKLSNMALPGAFSFFRQTALPINDGTLSERGSVAGDRIDLTSSAVTQAVRDQIRDILLESGVPETAFSNPPTNDEVGDAIEILETIDYPDAMPRIIAALQSVLTIENRAGRQTAGYANFNGDIDDMERHWPRGDMPGEYPRDVDRGDKFMISRLVSGETGELARPDSGDTLLPSFARHGFSKIAVNIDYDGAFISGAETTQIEFDFGSMNLSALSAGEGLNRSRSSISAGNAGTGDDGITQFSDHISTIRSLRNNGRGAANLSSIQINEEGLISGRFANGETRDLSQVPLIVFQNPNGLSPAEGLSFSETHDSGQPFTRQANAGGAGQIVSNATESSSVDLAQEFSAMIVSQRGFSASAKVVSTTQAMIDELSQRL